MDLFDILKNFQNYLVYAAWIFLIFCFVYVLYINKLLWDLYVLSLAKKIMFSVIFIGVFLFLGVILIAII
ncbi:MAG: hypothetical protein UT37_C0008G0011 [Parcubacteria group bacterium GW2011_GWA2_39_18]|nr:MAG: hypothetical protein UT37_C0008G0011 [Parcubacteria group bacterium GW2011_GWA2_39_18]